MQVSQTEPSLVVYGRRWCRSPQFQSTSVFNQRMEHVSAGIKLPYLVRAIAGVSGCPAAEAAFTLTEPCI